MPWGVLLGNFFNQIIPNAHVQSALWSQFQHQVLLRIRAFLNRSFKGQLGVPLTVYPWYLLCSLGILGFITYNPAIDTHYIGLI